LWFPIRCQHPTRSASWPGQVAAASASVLRPPPTSRRPHERVDDVHERNPGRQWS
jgi:hypothetical protein